MAEILELFIITYNRSTHLDSTLHQLVGCPFSRFSITIVDNCSTDNTHEIYLAYKEKFPRLNYIRNKVNIGADANVLRAAELSTSEYTWILCDDDEYCFESCDDVITEIAKGEVAAIMVGWSKDYIWPIDGMYGTPESLMQKGFPYFSVPTFVPGSIFKTSIFQNQIRVSYTNIVNLLPAMTFYISLYKTAANIYISKSKIVTAGGMAGYQYSFLKVMCATINTFYLIPHKGARRAAFYSSYLKPPYFSIYKHALMWKTYNKEFGFLIKLRYFKILDWKGKIIFLFAYLIAPIANQIKLPENLIAQLKRYRV